MFTGDGYPVLMMTGLLSIKNLIKVLGEGAWCYININLFVHSLNHFSLYFSFLAISPYRPSLLMSPCKSDEKGKRHPMLDVFFIISINTPALPNLAYDFPLCFST